MPKRHIKSEAAPDRQSSATLREATLRAERAERELAELKAKSSSDPESMFPKEHGTKTDSTGEAETALRNDSMMGHLLDSLAAGKDIGHYGRLVFAMVARHFLPHEEVVRWLMRDPDFTEEQANVMLRQVEGRNYNPPRRERILEWQAEQEFPILPNPDDPDCGNLYRNLKFPDSIYHHIEHYQEQKVAAEDAA